MFTGIVEEVGTVASVDTESAQDGLRVAADLVLDGTQVGDSISVNGVCLTVTSIVGSELHFGVMQETLRRSNLGELGPNDQVNLERALQPSTRMGGHFVQGHADGTGEVLKVEQEGSSLLVRIGATADILRYVVEKGFIAVDGASLTVTAVDDESFSVALVSFTQSHIAERLFSQGKSVNLEVDVLAKYVEKLVVH
jgi:riboflavin synthase